MTQFRLNIHGQERALELTRQGERLHVGVGGEFDDFMDRVGLPRKRAIFNGCNVGAARPAGGPNIS